MAAVEVRQAPPIYGNWPELQKEVQLVELYYGPHGALQCGGVFTRAHDVEFRYPNGLEGHLAVCRKENRVMVYPFGAKVASKPVQDLRPCMKNIWNSNSVVGNEYCKYIHLADVAAICG